MYKIPFTPFCIDTEIKVWHIIIFIIYLLWSYYSIKQMRKPTENINTEEPEGTDDSEGLCWIAIHTGLIIYLIFYNIPWYKIVFHF